MQQVLDCYKKVSKDCFKFIKSQETSKEKFKNKEKMIKNFLIPISFWISNRAISPKEKNLLMTIFIRSLHIV